MKITLDASDVMRTYDRGLRRLYALDGFDQRKVLRAETGVILKTWAGRTKVARADTVELYARYRAGKRAFGLTSAGKNMFGITVNTGRREGTPGMVWFRTARKKWQTPASIYSGGYISQNHLHFKDDDWARIEAGMVTYANELKHILPASQKAVGLARQSVIQIADGLGLDLNAVKGGGSLSAAGIAKARAAIASTGSQYTNGGGTDNGDPVKYYIAFFNTYPMNQKLGMDRALLSIINGRAKYIEQSYKKGAFDSMKNTVRAFPNLFRQTGLDVPASDETAA